MTKYIHTVVEDLLNKSTNTQNSNDGSIAWLNLEEAHILSQPFAVLHIKIHWNMLRLAIKEKNLKEVLGQVIRLILAGPGSLLKKYPVGNTGRSNVSMFKPMSIPNSTLEKMRSDEP